jgi:hypothetical protein
MRTLASRLKQFRFSLEAADGFIVQRVRDLFIEGTYFEKFAFDEIVRDPFGNEETFNRVIYRDVEFVFKTEYPHIELRKFSRSTSGFFSRTSEATGFSAAFAPLRVDIFKWAEGIREIYPKLFRIDVAQLADVFLEENVSARMVIAGRDDVRSAYQRFTAGRGHVVERVQIKIRHDDAIVGIQLSTDGTMRSADVVSNDILSAVRRALPKSSGE